MVRVHIEGMPFSQNSFSWSALDGVISDDSTEMFLCVLF